MAFFSLENPEGYLKNKKKRCNDYKCEKLYYLCSIEKNKSIEH